jgi:UTP--glucose-1-phosphate uridylyltransferase
VIHYVVEEAVNSGLDEILIIVGHGKDAIIDYFDYHALDETMDNYGIRNFPDIYFIRQKKPMGLDDALRYAEKFVDDDPFVVLLGDTIYVSETNKTVTSQLLYSYSKIKSPLIAVEEVKREKIRDYGIISGRKIKDNLWKVEYLVEKPEPENSPSNLGITGIYILHSEIFDYIKEIKPGKNNEYQLTDALNLLAKEKNLYASTFRGKRFDIGAKELWYETFIEFLKLKKLSRIKKF